MLTLKQISFFNWISGFRVLLLIALLLPTNSALAEAPAQDSSSYEKQMPANGARSRIPATDASFTSFTGTNLIQDPSFEASYGSGTYWGQYSTNFGTPLCILADCTDGGGTAGPRTGSVWGWLGGTPNNEASDLYQYVTFPSCGATLQFYLWIGFAAPGSDVNDYFAAAIDGNLVFTTNATQKNLYPAYTLVSVDVSAYANGATHLVEFFSVTSGQTVTFNLDDIALSGNCIISGNVGAADVTLSYTDNTAKTVTSSVNGNYSLPVSLNWNGTVTPSHPCFTFSPTSQTYSNVIANQASQNFTATFNAGSGCANIDVTVGGIDRGKFGMLPGASTRAGFSGIDSGPVKVSSANGVDILAALRVIWKEPNVRFSYSEMMGLPAEQLSTEYWFPWYNNAVPSSMDQGFRIANVNATGTNTIEVSVGGSLINSFTLGVGESVRVSYSIDNGPIRIACTTCAGNEKIIAALRIIWKEPGFRSSYSEMMGLPVEQLSNEYWFPWYNNLSISSMDQGFRIANVDTSSSNTVEVWVGTSQLDTIVLGPGASTRVSYAVDNGPIRIECSTCTNLGNDKIIAALRVIWKEPGFRASYSEMMGFPTEQLSSQYWFPWYNNAVPASMDQGFRIANVDAASNTIEVWVGSTNIHTFALDGGASVRVSYSVDNGPIRIVCVSCTNTGSDKILAALRVIWKEPGFRASYSEMMGLPHEALSTEYWFPWYNFAAPNSMDQGFRIAVP